MVAARGLHKREGNQLRKRQRRRHGPVQKPGPERLPSASPGRGRHAVGACTRGKQHQRQIAVRMGQRQPACKQAQQHQLAHAVTLPAAQRRHQEVEGRHQQRPAAQNAALGHQHVADDVDPAQVVGIGLIGGRLIIALHHVCQVVPHGGDFIAVHRGVQRVEKAQAAVEEQEEKRQCRRPAPSAQLHGQKAVAGINQRHHHGAGEGHGGVERHAQHEHAGGDGVRQVGVGHGGPQHQAVFQREGRVDDAGAHRQVQGQVAIGALPHMIGAVRRQADGMRVLQVAAEHRQRHDAYQQQPERPLFRLVKGGGRTAVAPQPGRPHQQRQRAQRQPVRRIAEAHRIGPQDRQPHQQKHAQRQAQVDAQHRLEPGQEQACDRRSAR